jgi:hypothetical protein
MNNTELQWATHWLAFAVLILSQVQSCSASRGQMFSNHLGQKLVVNGLNERYLQTGWNQSSVKRDATIKMPTEVKSSRLPVTGQIHRHGQHQWESTNSCDLRGWEQKFGIIGFGLPLLYHQYMGFNIKLNLVWTSLYQVDCQRHRSLRLTSYHGHRWLCLRCWDEHGFHASSISSEDGIKDLQRSATMFAFKTRLVCGGVLPLSSFRTSTEPKTYTNLSQTLESAQRWLFAMLRANDKKLRSHRAPICMTWWSSPLRHCYLRQWSWR